MMSPAMEELDDICDWNSEQKNQTKIIINCVVPHDEKGMDWGRLFHIQHEGSKRAEEEGREWETERKKTLE